MLVRRLPKSFNFDKGITPPVYADHFLFAENLSHPYDCPEHPSGLRATGNRKGELQIRWIRARCFSLTGAAATLIFYRFVFRFLRA
jgi:hypothetical protein